MSERPEASDPESGKDPTKSCDPSVAECPLGDLSVRVVDGAGKPVEHAAVTVEGIGSLPTDKDGWAHWKKINPGTYKVTARKDAHTPDPAEKAGVKVPEGGTAKEELKLELVEYHLHVDADRDGKVDDDRSGLDAWDWGKGKKGAIILCNDDGDGASSKSDNSDDKINSGNDKDEVSPLEVRHTGANPPASWELTLEVDDKKNIRIFDKHAAGGKEIIGPAKGKKYKFPDLTFAKRELGMEATKYADGSFDGEVTLTLTLKAGGKSISEKAKLRVAPWIMPNHIDEAETVFVVHKAYNAGFVSTLKPLVAAAGCSLKEHSSDDRWMQDCMEWGYSSLPNVGIRSVMRAVRNFGAGDLKTFPKTLRRKDLGYYEPAPVPASSSTGSTLDSNGNLEVTPPCKSKAGKVYPYGRIYFGGTSRVGESFSSEVRSFLEKQVVQEPISDIDTTWLAVAHIDELVSFVPAPDRQGFRMLIASPKRAYEILNAKKATHPTAKMLIGRDFHGGASVETTIKNFLDHGLPMLKPKFTAKYLDDYNKDRQDDIDKKILAKIKDRIGIDPAKDVIHVPVLFADIAMATLADALTAGMVNMLVINKHCIYPKPFGPEVGGVDLFEKDMTDQLKKLGLKPKPIDDWHTYHVNMGEVHCGTNTLRKPVKANWWEFEP